MIALAIPAAVALVAGCFCLAAGLGVFLFGKRRRAGGDLELPGGIKVKSTSGAIVVTVIGFAFVAAALGFDGGGSGSGSTTKSTGSATVTFDGFHPAGKQAIWDVDVGVTGLQSRAVRIAWSLLGANSQQPVAPGYGDRVVDTPTPDSQDWHRTYQVHVPAGPGNVDQAYLEVQVQNDRGEEIGFGDSETVSFTGPPPPP